MTGSVGRVAARWSEVTHALAEWLRQGPNLVLVACGLFLLAAAATVPLERRGDGSEYILATESLYFDHDLIVTNRVDLFRHIDRRPQGLDTPAGLTRMPGADGVERFGVHSFYYPLASVPFYAAFGYQGFYVLNALMVLATIAAAYRHLARTQPESAAIALAAGGVFLSAMWSYVFWPQTEAFYVGLLALHLYLHRAGRPLLAAVCGGIAAGAQFPLAIIVLPMLVEVILERRLRTALAIAGIYAACAAPQIYYDLHYLGTLFPAARIGLAGARYVSGQTWLRMLLDPAMGLFWFYPVAAYCLVQLRLDWRSTGLLLAGALMLLVMTSTRVVYSHQVGTRYDAYLLPVLLFCVGRVDLAGIWSRLAAAFTVVVGAGLAINPLGNSRDMDLRHATFLPYRVASALGLGIENPEVFQASSDPLVPDRVYTRKVTHDRWTWGDDKAIVMIVGAHPGPMELDLRSYPGNEPLRVQRVTVTTMSGQCTVRDLPPSEVTRISIPLRPGDVREYVRWGKTYTYVTIAAEAWSPAETLEGHPPEAHDMRRLGVNLERLAIDGETFTGK